MAISTNFAAQAAAFQMSLNPPPLNGCNPVVGPRVFQALGLEQQDQAAQLAHEYRDLQVHQDAVTLNPQARFDAAVQHFGDSLGDLDPSQRAEIAALKQQVAEEAQQAQARGVPYDSLSQFTADTMHWAAQGLQSSPFDQKIGAVFDYGQNLIEAERANNLAQQAGLN